MFLTKISVHRPVAMFMVIVAVVIFGIIAFVNLSVDLMPDVELPYVTVQTIYNGAGPEEIETVVIKPVEEQLSTVNGVKNITSFATEGVGYVILEFNIGVNPDLAAIDVKDKVDAILYSLPRDLQKPVISKFDINDQPIINLALTGPVTSEKLRVIADKQIKERLLKINGVARIPLTGGREREIQINLHKHRMDGLNISIETVAGLISAQTVNIPGGHVSGSRKEYTVRVQGEFKTIDEIKNIGIPVGRDEIMVMVPLHTIADVVDSYKEARELSRFNGNNSVGLSVYKRSDANIVKVSNEVLEIVNEMNRELPAGTVVNVAQDRSKFIRDMVKNMYNNILIGMGLTALMLLVFLRDLRITIISALTIPASIVFTFIGMQFSGLNINMMTLMALAISVGTLVTNVIIVLENIARHRDSGVPVKEASIIGADEVFKAVMASVLTNVAVFLPMANMTGITGQFFKSLGLTIVFATVSSLFLSFSLAPMMASLLLKNRLNKNGVVEKRSKSLVDKIADLYIYMLKITIRLRVLAVSIILILFVITMYYVAPKIGMEFFPQADEGLISISIEMPSGTSLKETDKALAVIEKRLFTIPEINSVNSSLGGGEGTASGVNFASLIVNLKDKKDRIRSSRQITDVIRPLLADIPDATVVIKAINSMGGEHSESDIAVEITGEQISEILQISDSVRTLAQNVSGLTDFQLSWKSSKPEIKFTPKRQILDEYGISVASIGQKIRYSITGSEAAVFRDENDEYTIRVQCAEESRNTIDAIENISISTAKGIVPAKVLVDVKNGSGAANIDRQNRQRLVKVMANVSSGSSGIKNKELKKLTDNIKLPPGYRIHYGGQQEMMNDSFYSLIFTMILAVVLTFMVLAGSIESFVKPFLIMFSIPLGFIGVVWALYLTGQTISMVSLMSTIMLVGVVVNNAILIIDYANILQKQGLHKFDAVIEACRVKFSAIIMMNIAIVLAMLPQAVYGSSIDSPFAITAIGGIVMSTAMTLFVIPAMYLFGTSVGTPTSL